MKMIYRHMVYSTVNVVVICWSSGVYTSTYSFLIVPPVSQEVSTSEAEASAQPSHTEYCQVLVKQETSGPGFPEPQEHGPSQDEGEPQDLLEGDACLKYEQSTGSSSRCQTQTVDSGERDFLPGTSTGWIKTEEEAEDYGGSDFLQPLSSESGDGGDTSDPSLNINKQTNQRPFCGESFHHRTSLMMGVKSHANDADHAMSALLETHMENNLCLICGKTFSRRSNLKRHMLIHTCQKPHCCKECGKRFTRVESLRIHTRIHTVERPYACDVCGKGFRQRSNMLFHLRTHTGRNPHRCGICSTLFARKKDVIRHMQVHAKKTWSPSVRFHSY